MTIYCLSDRDDLKLDSLVSRNLISFRKDSYVAQNYNETNISTRLFLNRSRYFQLFKINSLTRSSSRREPQPLGGCCFIESRLRFARVTFVLQTLRSWKLLYGFIDRPFENRTLLSCVYARDNTCFRNTVHSYPMIPASLDDNATYRDWRRPVK